MNSLDDESAFDPNELIETSSLVPTEGYQDSFQREILALETSEIDDYEVAGDEIAIYVSQPALARIHRLSSKASKQPLVAMRLAHHTLTAMAGDQHARIAVTEAVIAVKPDNHEGALEFAIDCADLGAVVAGAQGTIRLVYSPASPAIDVTSVGFTRPLVLHSVDGLPRFLRLNVEPQVLESHPVKAAPLSRAVKYLVPFAQLHPTGEDRTIEFKDSRISAGTRAGGAAQMRSDHFRNLDFSLDHTHGQRLTAILDDDIDANVNIKTTDSYVIFEMGRATLVVPRSGSTAHPTLIELLALTLENNFDRAMLDRHQLQQFLPRVSDETDTVRITYCPNEALVFTATLENGEQSQFKLAGQQRKNPPQRPNPDFRTRLSMFVAALHVSQARYVYIDSLTKGALFIDEGEEEDVHVRTVLPMLPISRASTRRQPRNAMQNQLTISAEEMIDDNL